MTVTIEQVVGDARSMVVGALGNDVSRLKQGYTPGSPTLVLLHEKKVGEGAMISAGITTLVAAQSTTGAEVAVVHGYDGSPDVSVPADTLVHLRPRHTTWQVFREVASTVTEIASPRHGLYRVVEEEHPVDVVDGTYVLAQPALKVLRVRYRRPGSKDDWYDVGWRFQAGAPLGPTVRTTTDVPGGTTVHIQYAATFLTPQSLDDTLDALNIPDEYQRLLAVGAARNLSLSTESRRAQPFSQGDPRRAEEVSMGNSAMVYDRLRTQFRDLVADARANLVSQHPYRFKMEQFT